MTMPGAASGPMAQAPQPVRRRYFWRRTWAMLVKEFIQLRRDRVSFAMIIMIPLIQLMLFGYAINTNPRHLPTAVLLQEKIDVGRSIIKALENTKYFDVTHVIDNEAEFDRLLKSGTVLFAVEIPANFERALRRGDQPALLVAADATDPVAAGSAMAALGTLALGNALAGQFVVNGAAQGGGREIDVLPGDIGNTFFNVGTLGGSDLLWARLIESNGQATEWKSFSVTAPLARLPSLSVSGTLAARGDSIALSTLVRVTDTDSVGFQALHLWDSNGTIAGGRFVVGEVPQDGGRVIMLAPSDIANTVFHVGTLGGTDQLWAQIVQANGELSSWVPFTVTALVAQLPTLVVQDDRTATAGETIALARLVTVVDPENVGFQSVQLWDSNGTPAGGQFVIGETPQTGGHIIEIAPADLANTVFHVGTLGATDLLWAQIVQSNGQASGWQPFKIEVAADDAATTLDATFRSAGGVKFVAFKLDYDPELVTVADAERGADLPDTARISLRTTETEDGAEAYITVTSDEPIPAGTVKLASISVSSRSAGRHLDGLRKLHVHDVNGVSSREGNRKRAHQHCRSGTERVREYQQGY
jgi:ABC-2 family transporter protein